MYYIIEIQEQADGTVAHQVFTETDQNKALSIWHGILQYAAVSEVYIHGAIVLDSDLRTVERETYRHYAPVIEVDQSVIDVPAADEAEVTGEETYEDREHEGNII